MIKNNFNTPGRFNMLDIYNYGSGAVKVTLNFDKATESLINMFLMHKSKWSKNTIHSRSVFI